MTKEAEQLKSKVSKIKDEDLKKVLNKEIKDKFNKKTVHK